VTEVIRRARALARETSSPRSRLYPSRAGASNESPAACGRAEMNRPGQLEAEDRSELNPSRSAATEEGVTDTYVTGSADRIGAGADLLIITIGGKA
jgi:hypothetical protein